MKKKNKKIKLETYNLESGYSWLETVLFGNDDLMDIIGYMMGMFHCKQCDTYLPYVFKMPPKYICPHHPDGCFDEAHKDDRYENIAPSKEAHNARNAFWREHCHGDGRIILFEKDID